MENIREYIDSGIIEQYVLGTASEADTARIEQLALIHPEINTEIEEITQALLNFDKLYSKNLPAPGANVKPFLMAVIDYTERLKNGEQPATPPILNEDSKASDFATWLERGDMVPDENAGSAFARIIGHNALAMTAIVWLKEGAPAEVHDREYEKFLILEGSCEIITSDEVFNLTPGRYFQIPLHVRHSVRVTSQIPCKLILQRMAA